MRAYRALKKNVSFPFNSNFHLHLDFLYGVFSSQLVCLQLQCNSPGTVVLIECVSVEVRNLFYIPLLTTDIIPWTFGWTCNQSSATTAANLAIHQSWHHNRNTNTMWIWKGQFFIVHHRRWKMAPAVVTCPKLAENKRHGDQQEDTAEQMEDSPVDGGRMPCSDNENDSSCAIGAVKSSPSSLNARARVWKWSSKEH